LSGSNSIPSQANDFPEVLMLILDTLAQQSVENGYHLIAADLRATARRAELYFRYAEKRSEKTNPAKKAEQNPAPICYLVKRDAAI
jgi:hypothetical protein